MNNAQGVYWLRVVESGPHRSTLEAEEGYKNCRRPGKSFRVMLGPDGPICPGCSRVCRIPAASGLTRDDEIVMQKHVTIRQKGSPRVKKEV
jgi:hypothetical protein